MLIIKYNQFSNELIYSLDIILKELLGLEYQFKKANMSHIEISQKGSSSKLSLDVGFFKMMDRHWLKPESMPVTPLKQWEPQKEINIDLINPIIPIIFGEAGIEKKNNQHWHINLDIFGSAFFMLSRYEELIIKTRDEHNRFPASASVVFKEDFLNRPIIDEYTEILWACLLSLWSNLTRKKHIAKTSISCDVDEPFDCTVVNFKRMIRTCSADLIKRKSIKMALERLRRYIFNKIGDYQYDPNYTFDWYMDVCEKNNLQATFFFIPDSSEPNNGCYKITNKKIVLLMKTIVDRGHEIGVHGSYYSYNDPSKILKQKNLLQYILDKENIKTIIKGNRQHYLRWDSTQTAEHLDIVGFQYDTTGGFAERPGFKYGTSKEFSMWGWNKKQALNLKQRPLIVMECTLIDSYFMGLSFDQSKRLIEELRKQVAIHDGDFNILWHNSYLKKTADKKLFEYILKIES